MKIKLSNEEIEGKLPEFPEWRLECDQLKKAYRLQSFRQAIDFVVRISHQAEEIDHHPEIFNCYNRVEISICTHDAGNKVTAKDFDLARAIDSVR